VRNIEEPRLIGLIRDSWAISSLDTMRILFHGRDCRGGKGDRRPFLFGMRYLMDTHPDWFLENFREISNYGRFLDLVELYEFASEEHQDYIIDYFVETLRNDIDAMVQNTPEPVSLLAKWLPSENRKWAKTGLRQKLCKALFQGYGSNKTGALEKRLRREYISPLRAHLKIVEAQMCAGEWDEIEYSHVPSVAMTRLRKAFKVHDGPRFESWIEDVKNKVNNAKVNAGQVYPHQLVKPYMDAGKYAPIDLVLEEQWASLLASHNSQSGSRFKNMVVLSDVSGSMNGVPMEVSVALGILISSLAPEDSPFHKRLLTFSRKPTFHDFSSHKTLVAQVKSVMNMPWGESTNFSLALDRILEVVVEHELSSAPEALLILSDMQFDYANSDSTHFELAKKKFTDRGLEFPRIIFWNLRGDTDDFQVSSNTDGVVLLSGFSPALLSLLGTDDFSPLGMVRAAIDDKRYANIRAPEEPDYDSDESLFVWKNKVARTQTR